MGGTIITPTIGAGRRNLEKATVGMVVATATAGETVGTAAKSAAAASSDLITSSYIISTTTVGDTDTNSSATTTVTPATISAPTIAPWR